LGRTQSNLRSPEIRGLEAVQQKRLHHRDQVGERSVVATEAIGRIRAFDAKARFPPPEGGDAPAGGARFSDRRDGARARGYRHWAITHGVNGHRPRARPLTIC
ncbi:MAG: hypothetical protein J0H19_15815, partial [Rhodospirillales bacterium]|nr:hypothetical protein [Rhodospirillales bacterium]